MGLRRIQLSCSTFVLILCQLTIIRSQSSNELLNGDITDTTSQTRSISTNFPPHGCNVVQSHLSCYSIASFPILPQEEASKITFM